MQGFRSLHLYGLIMHSSLFREKRSENKGFDLVSLSSLLPLVLDTDRHNLILFYTFLVSEPF